MGVDRVDIFAKYHCGELPARMDELSQEDPVAPVRREASRAGLRVAASRA